LNWFDIDSNVEVNPLVVMWLLALVGFEYEKNLSGLNFAPVSIILLEQPISSVKTKASQALLI
jgi:hypothetical protein